MLLTSARVIQMRARLKKRKIDVFANSKRYFSSYYEQGLSYKINLLEQPKVAVRLA